MRLNPADPLPVFPDGFQGGQVARVEDVLRGGDELAPLEIVPGVAGADSDKLQDAGVAVAVNHAARAAVANELRLVEVIDVAHWGFPEVAAVEVEVPVKVEILVAAQAAEL